MAATSLIAVLTQHLNCGIAFLEQLHVLSQTEALILEQSDFEELEPIFRAKAQLVSQIDENRNDLAATVAGVGSGLSELPAASRDALEALKQRALQLVEMIGHVDERNRLYLENLKAEAVQSSQVLLEDDKLRRAYSTSDATLTGFSKLLD